MALPERPRLRSLEAFPFQQDGQRMIGLRDPSGFTDQVAVLPMPLLDVISLFDGDHAIDEIRDIVAARHGGGLTAGDVLAVAERLDEAGFLDSPRFAERRRRIESDFAASPTRPAAHAGGAYPDESEALREQIAGFFAHADGPGAAPGTALEGRESLERMEATRDFDPTSLREGLAATPGFDLRSPQGATSIGWLRNPQLRGLLAPHIDFHRGGPVYAWAYREVLERCDADLFVVLGTCHAGMTEPFAATLKAFETPLGSVPADREFLDALGRRYGGDLFASEGAHRVEHSIEFQAVMLRWALGDRPFTMVPLLASFLHEAVWTGKGAEADGRVPRFLGALAETLAASPRRVCVVGGVDLAHVGPRFGDAEPNTPAFLAEVERQDRAMLETVIAADAPAFFASVAADGDARRICGLSPIYTFLRVLPGAPGRLLRYRQWPDPEGTVSFCAAAFS
ncbi:MAG TPA: AmmeMemoRadiSam system protein B [Pseudomonadales bacterium]|nr:AmmeMemoRadiSam system protein B [Pseudomonadales bacterium]